MRLHSSHWGAFTTVTDGGKLTGVKPFPGDPNPSEILLSIPGSVHHRTRVERAYFRAGWLKGEPDRDRHLRGRDRFVAVPWDEALDLVAAELKRIVSEHGNEAIFGGSYGWSSAGRFHHAKSQLQRFLAVIGGYTGAVNTYSNAAGTVLAQRVLGDTQSVSGPCTAWPSILANCEFLVMFGGLPLRNTQVTSGGVGEHLTRDRLAAATAAGIQFCNISPVRDDLDSPDALWLAPRPNTDTALILALCHTLLSEQLHDGAFLDRYCVGFDAFRRYVAGEADGTAKDADWAARITDIAADDIRVLARRMASKRTMLMMTWSLQRADHGEQPYWALITLAAMLGQIGLPGTGFGFGYGSVEGNDVHIVGSPTPALRAKENPVRTFIPVARIADALLTPGGTCDYDGQRIRYPEIKAVYWCGGNPFHHHQDINRLIEGWRRPDTVIINECWWTASAQYADIVLPATTSLERNDIGATSRARHVFAMKRAIEPVGEARNDFDIFSDLADRFGLRAEYTEGRNEMAWVRHLYEAARDASDVGNHRWPEFGQFWENGWHVHENVDADHILYGDFRRDPDRFPLKTKSGRIEIFCKTIDAFGYDDCAGHAKWFEPREWLGAAGVKDHPLHMLSCQPAGKLHSQMDMGVASQNLKLHGREPIRMNPDDAVARRISDGDLVDVYNDRGCMIAVARIDAGIRPGVVQIATGAWYDPEDRADTGSRDKHGNPNVLTLDKGTSKLAQGCVAQTALVQVRSVTAPVSPVTAYALPDGVREPVAST